MKTQLYEATEHQIQSQRNHLGQFIKGSIPSTKGKKFPGTGGRKDLGISPLDCPNCKKRFYKKNSYIKWAIKRGSKIYCSNWCARHSANFKGGKISAQGYLVINSKLQHRLVMERELGKKLSTKEHVHHINGVKTDNRIDNLVVIDIHDHGVLHGKHKTTRA